MKVIYIAGLGHSGSTFLELLLASHEGLVGLGEVGLQVERLLLEPSTGTLDERCSCGFPVRECAFWGELAAKPWQDRDAAYDTVFAKFEETFPRKVLVDSSKGLRHLQQYRASNRSHDLGVVLIVRDYRGWALSRSKTNRNKGRRDWGYVFNAYHWMFANLRLIWRLSRAEAVALAKPFVFVAYEDLVFSQQAMLQKIFAARQLPQDESMAERKVEAHNVFGNGMRLNFQIDRRIKYDHRWMLDSRVVLLAPLVLPVHLYQALQRSWLLRRERRNQRRAAGSKS